MRADLLLGSSRHNPACFLAAHGVHERGPMPPCDGRLVRCHLIPRNLLIREFPPRSMPGRAEKVYRNRASWVMGCGGIPGNCGHHGMLDTERTLRIPRFALPADLEKLAVKYELTWWLDREYGERP